MSEGLYEYLRWATKLLKTQRDGPTHNEHGTDLASDLRNFRDDAELDLTGNERIAANRIITIIEQELL